MHTGPSRFAQWMPGLRDSRVEYLTVMLRERVCRARALGAERGASALEWVVIAAIVVGIVAVVGGVITTALTDRADEVSDCIGTADGSEGSKC
ncbi:hypothetical protein [Streptomyces sp. YIM 98790]|uniref:hypothetical protein n=1 Tax=Streptomyces sp. YIM 98790 TaxID=2689077 RepID=UPI0028BEE6C4|nr:hypothetical protein [Streptomyces sp. YIM 98790]